MNVVKVKVQDLNPVLVKNLMTVLLVIFYDQRTLHSLNNLRTTCFLSQSYNVYINGKVIQSLVNQRPQNFWKSCSISKLIYPCHSLDVSSASISKVNSVIFHLLWTNKSRYIRKSQLVKYYNKGWIKALDFESMVGTLKSFSHSHIQCGSTSLQLQVALNFF